MSDEDEYSRHGLFTNLAVRVGSMEGTIKTFMDNWVRQDALAHESRRLTYERLEMIGKQIDRIATDVMNVQQDVAELKKEMDEEVMPSIKADDQAKQRVLGAKGVWAVLSAGALAVASMMAYIADKIMGFLYVKP